jgi:hypothetical protein
VLWGWDKNLPSRLLSALPKRSWIKRLRRLGLEVLVPLWRHAASMQALARDKFGFHIFQIRVIEIELPLAGTRG